MFKKAFSLIELIFVIAIIAIISSIAIPKLMNVNTSASVSSIKQDVNTIISSVQSYYLVNGSIAKISDAINLNKQSIKEENKTNVLFLVDSTWGCASSILNRSKNIKSLKKMSFTHTKTSNFTIKKQPENYCLSTMETTLCVLELLNKHKIENISKENLDNFLNPFEKMIEYQIDCASKSDTCNVRYKRYKS